MRSFRLEYGDIVVWEDKRDESGKELSHPHEIPEWWDKYLEDVRASSPWWSYLRPVGSAPLQS